MGDRSQVPATGTLRSKLALLLLLCLLLTACGKKTPASNHANELLIQPMNNNSDLYFSGTIKPIEIINVPSPIDGTVEQIFFHYGQKVKRDDPLLIIKSSKLTQDYQEA